MKKNATLSGLFFILIMSCQPNIPTQSKTDQVLWTELEDQLGSFVRSVDSENETAYDGGKIRSPRTLENGELKLVSGNDWCSGFFAGCLWLMYDQTGDEKWKSEAQKYTVFLKDQQWNDRTHDMGFKMYCTYGNGYRITGDSTYRDILINSANTLISRFNPKVGCIRSWDHNQEKWQYPVIIDNMMNLELLFWATRETGDSVYFKIAERHAITTLKNHFRPDYSCYHVVGYDPQTGAVMQRNTHQGYSDESAWSRGQAWALYGFTMVYRETKNPVFLEQAKGIAGFLFSNPNMPDDLIPYWDFNAPGIPNEPRDVSAAAVIASALLELEKYIPENADDYQSKANLILTNLNNFYRSKPGENKGFLLGHSTGSKPHDSEVDVPIIYADYYYLEALCRNKSVHN